MSITAIGRIGGGGGMKINAQTRQITPGIQLSKGDVVYLRYTPVETAPVPSTDINAIVALSMSRDGKYIACVGNGSPKGVVYRLNGDNTITKLNTLSLGDTEACSFSADGTYLATGSTGGGIRVFKNVNDSYTQLSAANFPSLGDNFRGVSFSGDGTYLLTVGYNNTLKRLVLFKRTAGTDAFTKLWDYSDRGHDECEISPDGRYIAFIDTAASPYIYLYRRDDNNNAVPISIPVTGTGSYYIRFSGDSKTIALGKYFNTTTVAFKIFRINDNDTLTEIPNSNVMSYAKPRFAQNDKKLVSGNQLLFNRNGYFEGRQFGAWDKGTRVEISNDLRYYAAAFASGTSRASIGTINHVFSKVYGQFDEIFIAGQACDGTNTIDAYALTE